jgi:pimeloyl-ACP methyl ester carboxylesterase
MMAMALLAVPMMAALAMSTSACGGGERPEDRYEGPIAPCEVELSRTNPDQPQSGPEGFEAARASVAPQFWKTGPYGVWNTSPAEACLGDPVMERVGDQRNVSLYLTYPAASVPTRSGLGDVAPGRWPVIIFAHANNDSQCDIYRRYYSLHDHWASWGFVVASVDGTYTNCRPGSKENIEKRIDGQLEAVEKLAALDADPNSRFFGRIDLDTVVFAGHSRGGGASLVAAERYGDAAGVIDIQGIDLTSFGFGTQTLPDFPVVGFTAGEDVDLNYPIAEPTEDQLGGPYTWVNINGGIHAYTADTVPIEPDDEPLIERGQQHDVTEYYSTAFLARFVEGGDGSVLFSHAGAGVVDQEISELGVFQRWRSDAPANWIDRFDGDSPDENLTGGQNTSSGLDRSEELTTYRPDENAGAVYRKSVSRLLEAGDSGTFRLELDGVQAPAKASLQARIKGPDVGEVAQFSVTVELADPAGQDASTYTYAGADFIGPEPLGNRFTQLVIPGDDFAEDMVSAIEFEVSKGAVFIDDLRWVHQEG